MLTTYYLLLTTPLRPFRDEADLLTALEAAKSMAHVLLDKYDEQLAERPPDLDFMDHEQGSSCGAAAAAQPMSVRPALDVPRVWKQMLGGETAQRPPSTPQMLGGGAAVGGGAGGGVGVIKAGSKDERKLRRGPATTGGSGGAVGAIAG